MAGNGVVLKPASLTPLIGAAHPGGVRARGRARGARAHRARRRRGGPGAGRVERRQDLLHRLGRGRPRRGRGVRAAHEGLGARAGRQGPDDRAAPTPNLPNAVSGCLWGGFANAGQTCSGIERVYVVREVAERFIEGVVRGRASGCASATRSTRTPRSARWSRASSSSWCSELVDDAVAAGATLHCGGPLDVSAPRRQLLRARRAHRRDPRHADHARGDLRAGGPDRDGGRPRTRRSRWPTTPSSASARRSGR